VNESIVRQVIEGAAAQARSALSEIESKQILEALGIATTMAQPARSAEEAARLAAQAGFPVVLKVLSPEASHKTEVGGVALNLGSAEEVREAFERIRRNLAHKMPQARFDGVAVQAMAPPGIELLAGITRDAQFGPLVMVGLGGILVEALGDTAVRLAPVSAREAREMFEQLRAAVLLKGVRGSPPVDQDALVALVVKLSELAAGHPEIREMDLNPVVAYPNGLKVLDARVLLDLTRPAATDQDTTRTSAERRARRHENLKRALRPRAVAVVGDRGSRDYMWLRALEHFKGDRYSVQSDPREEAGLAELGVKNFKSVTEIPGPVDYAMIAVPRQAAPNVLRDCVAKGVAGVGFFTAGFSELGDEAGVKLEAELREIALNSDIALVGPNCMGLCNPSLGLLNAARLQVGPPGDVSFISQSGTHAISFCMQAPWRAIKVDTAASIGNATVLEAADYLDVVADDPATRVIGLYIEGVRDGHRFFASLRRAARRHPVVVWKGGVTESGARATFSHTGSLATSSAVWRAAMLQGGAVEVPNLEAMLDAVELLRRSRPVKGRKMGLVAMTGGQSVVISDAFARYGLEVPELSESSYAEFKSFFNVIGGSYRNPLDAAWTVGPGSGKDNLERVLDILDRDPVLDAIVMEVRPGFGFVRVTQPIREEDIAALLDRLARFNQRAHKPFALVAQWGHQPPELEANLIARTNQLVRERDLVGFDSFERAAAAFLVAAECHEARTRLNAVP
jgi:acetate---CoA ligase (ADP-forming) subunit alpha